MPPPPLSTVSCPNPVSAHAPAVAGSPPIIPPPPPSANLVSLDLVEQIVDRAVDRTVDRALDRAVNRAVERTVDRAVCHAVDRAISRVVDDIHNLYIGRLEWGELQTVHLTSAQHRMLSKISHSQWNGSDPIIMNPLDFAGRLCFTQHSEDSSAPMFVDNLLRVTQDMASTTEEGNPLYWNHRMVFFLNKRVEVELDGKSYSGMFMGANTLQPLERTQSPVHVYRIQLSKSTELILDLRKFENGNAHIRELGETASEMVDKEEVEEMADC